MISPMGPPTQVGAQAPTATAGAPGTRRARTDPRPRSPTGIRRWRPPGRLRAAARRARRGPPRGVDQPDQPAETPHAEHLGEHGRLQRDPAAVAGAEHDREGQQPGPGPTDQPDHEARREDRETRPGTSARARPGRPARRSRGARRRSPLRSRRSAPPPRPARPPPRARPSGGTRTARTARPRRGTSRRTSPGTPRCAPRRAAPTARRPPTGRPVRRHRGDHEQHRSTDPEEDVRPSPPVLRDQGGRERRTGQRAHPDPRDRDPDRERPVPVEPAADGRDHRHVPAGHGHPDAEAVPEVADPQLLRRGRHEQPDRQGHGPDEQHRSRPEPVHRPSAHRAEQEPAAGGDREDQRRRPAAGPELRGHRREERPEAVGHPEHGGHGDEGGTDGDPGPTGVEHVIGRARRRITRLSVRPGREARVGPEQATTVCPMRRIRALAAGQRGTNTRARHRGHRVRPARRPCSTCWDRQQHRQRRRAAHRSRCSRQPCCATGHRWTRR